MANKNRDYGSDAHGRLIHSGPQAHERYVEQSQSPSPAAAIDGAYQSLADHHDHHDDDNLPLISSNAARNKQSRAKRRFSLKPQVDWGQLKWLASLARFEIPLIAAGSVALLIGSGTNLIMPQLIGQLMDNAISESKDMKQLGIITLALFVIVLITGIFTGIRAFLFQLAGERVVARLRKRLFDTIIVQEIAYFDETKTGELLNRLSSDTKSLENAVTINVSMALRNVVQAVGGIIILFFISWKLTLVMLTVIPVGAIGAVVYSRFVKSLSKRLQDALAASADVAEESFSNVRTVRSFSQEKKQSRFYAQAIDVSYRIARKLAIAQGFFSGGMMFIGNFSVCLVLAFGGWLVLNDEMSAGSLMSFIIYTLFVAMAIGVLSSLWFDIIKALGATDRIYGIMIRKVHESSVGSGSGGRILDRVEGHIEFHNVHFAYPSRPDQIVLHGINLDLAPGKVLALVGESGSGKSTIASLMQRFYDPDSGHITLDGVEYKDLDPVWLRSIIGTVSQEPSLFSSSIRDNIAYASASASATDHEIVEAAKEANAHNFIMQFKDGYDTTVGERGIRLSGGQKQRIAIARALLQQPGILVFDEATSALDSESEHLVQQALERLTKGRTVLVIAHRLSTVKNADVVCVVSNGRIVEQGSYEELVNDPNSQFAKLVHRQLLATE